MFKRCFCTKCLWFNLDPIWNSGWYFGLLRHITLICILNKIGINSVIIYISWISFVSWSQLLYMLYWLRIALLSDYTTHDCLYIILKKIVLDLFHFQIQHTYEKDCDVCVCLHAWLIFLSLMVTMDWQVIGPLWTAVAKLQPAVVPPRMHFHMRMLHCWLECVEHASDLVKVVHSAFVPVVFRISVILSYLA